MKLITLKKLRKEKKRQKEDIELIASENYVSKNVLKALGSIATNKYAEGYPWKRYYWGCEYIDEIEILAQNLAKEIFDTDYEVNVQPHSWSSANMWVYLAVKTLLKKEKIKVLWMSLDAWWHLTHWAFPSFSWKKYWFFDSVSYWINKLGFLDYDEIEKIAIKEKPDLIIAGASAYSRTIDFNKFREIADKVGAYFLVDMAHIAGLIVAKEHSSPFWLADFITTTTHKTLRGPRGWLIFSKSKELSKFINSAIFPWIQGWPLENVIAAKAVCFEEAKTDSFKQYIKSVKENIKIFEKELKKENIDLVSNGTDNHLLLVDLRSLWISGKEAEDLLSLINVTVNKNSVPGDTNPTNPSWIRIGTPAITSRGINKEESKKIIKNIIKALKIFTNEKNIKTRRKKLKEIKKDNLNIIKNKTIFPEI